MIGIVYPAGNRLRQGLACILERETRGTAALKVFLEERTARKGTELHVRLPSIAPPARRGWLYPV